MPERRHVRHSPFAAETDAEAEAVIQLSYLVAGRAIGSDTVNVDPTPGWLSTLAEPPCCAAIH